MKGEYEENYNYFVLILISLNVFGQKTLDGFDWVSMSAETKANIMQGWYLFCIMVMQMTLELNQDLPTDQFQDLATNISNRFYYKDTIGEIVSKIDSFYASFDNRKFMLYKTIPYVAGKEWWNRLTGKVEFSNKS